MKRFVGNIGILGVLVLSLYAQAVQAGEGWYEFVWKQPEGCYFSYPCGIAVDPSGNVYSC